MLFWVCYYLKAMISIEWLLESSLNSRQRMSLRAEQYNFKELFSSGPLWRCHSALLLQVLIFFSVLLFFFCTSSANSAHLKNINLQAGFTFLSKTVIWLFSCCEMIDGTFGWALWFWEQVKDSNGPVFVCTEETIN